MLGVVLFKIDYNPTVFPILPLLFALIRASSSLSTLYAMTSTASPQIPPEILLTIFENISEPATLRHLRLVSSQFEELVTPIWCQEVILTPEFVAQYSLNKGWADYSILQIQMTVHTKHVMVKKELDWLLVNRLLSKKVKKSLAGRCAHVRLPRAPDLRLQWGTRPCWLLPRLPA